MKHSTGEAIEQYKPQMVGGR